MPEIENLGVFLVAAISLNMTPGPDTLYVLARSVGQGRRAGVVSVLGGSTGRLIHTFATALGLSALLVSSPKAYAVVKLLGAVYLVYLGVRMLFGGGEKRERVEAGGQSLARIYAQGLATNVLNPAVAAFFISFLPQFVNPERGSVAAQVVFLGVLFTTTATLWSLTVALLAGTFGNFLAAHPRFARAQRWLTGGILVALGARLAFV
ncbi:MAG TPA: LysE family translocator [Pyrinomonadaceae bacterium]